MIKDVCIAVAWGSPGGATAEISLSIEEMTGKRPKPIRLGDLAGPNETVQILLGANDWMLIFKAIVAIYGAEIIREAAKSSWKILLPKMKNSFDSSIGRFIRGISNARHAKAPVILGFPINLTGGRRHIGIEIYEATPEEIIRVINTLSSNGENIEKKLAEWEELLKIRDCSNISYLENSDCSVKLMLTEKGNITLQATIFGKDYKTKEEIVYEVVPPNDYLNNIDMKI